MKTKFNKSDISIMGNIEISVKKDNGNTDIYFIDLLGSKGKTKSGIYELKNKLNGKRYIGMARNLETRFQHHVSDLLLGKHKNKNLQEDFDTIAILGRDKISEFHHIFEMNVIIYCRPSELTFYENILINNLHPEYNIHQTKIDRIVSDEDDIDDFVKISFHLFT